MNLPYPIIVAEVMCFCGQCQDEIAASHSFSSVFHCDENGWKVYEKMEGKIGHRWYLWVFESVSSVIYRIEPTRSGDVPIKHFSSLSEKLKEVFVICDRYSGYKRLTKVNSATILAFCWVHMRRDYLEAAVQYPQLEPWMFEWRERIGEIYHLNARRLEHFDESRPLDQQSESFMRQQQRLERSVEQMERILKHELSAEKIHPAQLKVLSSLQNYWSGLMVLLKHNQVALDNNSGERKLRNPQRCCARTAAALAVTRALRWQHRCSQSFRPCFSGISIPIDGCMNISAPAPPMADRRLRILRLSFPGG